MQPNPLDRRFLERFPQEERSTVANRFLGAVRRGVREPDEVLLTVRAEVRERLAGGYRWMAAAGLREVEKSDRFLVALTRWRDEALTYARWCLAYEALPYEARAALKQQHMVEGRALAMSEKPMTERQASFIRTLGGDPQSVTTMKQASDLIEHLKGQRR